MARALEVSNLVRYLKNIIDSDLNIQNIEVKGEISNIVYSKAGHLYFTLKDAYASIRCVCFKTYAQRLNQTYKDGDAVVLSCSVSIYETSGSLQLYVTNISKQGTGDLYLEFIKIRDELEKAGYFDPAHKKDFPEYPLNIAVVVGKDSAAYTDIVTTFKRRWPLAHVDYYYSLVQGAIAHKEIIKVLTSIDDLGYDAIILARGGGSIEDLWPFNEKELALAIYNLKTFIITGIGHEIDYTIADMVADKRANTPTAAVELLTPNRDDLIREINNYQDYIHKLVLNSYNQNRNRLLTYGEKLNHYQRSFAELNNDVNQKMNSINNLLKDLFKDYQNKNVLIQNNLNRDMESILKQANNQKEAYLKSINNLIGQLLTNTKNHLESSKQLLESYSPYSPLSRGYSILIKDGNNIRNVDDVNVSEHYQLKMMGGELKILVEEKSHE